MPALRISQTQREQTRSINCDAINLAPIRLAARGHTVRGARYISIPPSLIALDPAS